jgi:diguanylate cyclase (GGDEF)-like protein/PAS domain S-box-containing protein
MGTLSSGQSYGQMARILLLLLLLKTFRQQAIKQGSFLAKWLKMTISLDFKAVYSAQPLINIMFYLILFLGVLSPQTAVHANEVKEVIAVQDHSVKLTPDEQKWLAKHKDIRIAYDGSLPPYSFVNDAGKIDGIAVEIMGILSERLGIHFTIDPDSNWSRVYKAAAKRKVDMVATMVNRPDRAEWFSFTKPYMTKSLVIVTKQGSTSINNRNDISDKKIAVVKGYQYGEQVGNEFPTAKRVKVNTMLDGLKEVNSGRVDAAILFLGTANYLQAKYQLGNLKIAAFFDRNSANESIAVRKDWPILVGILQKGLDSLTEQEVQKVFAKWVVEGGIPSSEVVTQKPQQPVEPFSNPDPNPPVIEVEQAPESLNIQKTVVNTSPEVLGISKMTVIFLIVLALFLLWLFLVRKQKKLQLKAKNEMMTSVRNLQSIHNDAMHLTIEPPVEIRIEEPIPQLFEKSEYPASEYIYYQHDCEGRFSYASPSVTSLLGYSEADFMANYRSYLTNNPINRHLDDYTETCIQGQPSEPYEVEMYDARGHVHRFEVMDSPVYDGLGHCIGVDGVMHDITAQRPYQEPSAKLSELETPVQSSHPQLLQEQLQQAIQLADQSQRPFALIFLSLEDLSLDHLRFLDDNLAQRPDDEVFSEASKRLRATLRDTDTVVPLGVDKFALIMPETDADAVGLIVEKIRKILQVPYLVGTQSVLLDAKIGVAVYPGNASDPESLISKAQVLLASSEAQMPNDTQPQKEGEESLKFQQDLIVVLDECKVSLRASSPHNINALHRHSQFSIYYQSRHNLEDYSITGFEALIRWHHPQFGLLLPKDFVPLVKDIGMLDVMTYWIIQQVSFQAVAWEKQGIRPKLMAINLGDLAMKQAVEVSKIIAIINETGAKPEWLEFSIPESEIAQNPDLVIPIISRLVATGAVVAIDNFGSDNSILALLKTIPAQIIEIDPAFIRDLPNNVEDAEIVTYSIAMLHELGKTVVAKEVETEQQMGILKASGCDVIQGHLLSRPLPVKEAKELMETLPDFAWYFQQE